jgi:hypothetical protein
MNEKSPVERSSNDLVKVGVRTQNNSIFRTSDHMTDPPDTTTQTDVTQVQNNEIEH